MTKYREKLKRFNDDWTNKAHAGSRPALSTVERQTLEIFADWLDEDEEHPDKET